MSIRYRIAHRAENDDPEGPLRFVIATEGRKGDGIDLRMDNVDLGRFQQNPVVMALHDYFQLPIGRAENVAVEDGKLMADAIFDLSDPRGAEIDRKYREGFMSAVSVGFDVYDVDDQGVPARWELLEFSAVPIPMDGDALVASGRQRAQAVIDSLRAGKVLSASNKDAIEQAVQALTDVLEAAREEDKDEGYDDEGRGGAPQPSRLQLAKRRLRLRELTSA